MRDLDIKWWGYETVCIIIKTGGTKSLHLFRLN